MDTMFIFTTSCSAVRVETPYFYWFDIDEGEEVNLVEKCPQLKLLQQCINHIGPLLRLLWKTGNYSTRTVEKCFKLLLWKIAIPNGFSAQHIDSVVRWGKKVRFNIQAS